MYNEYKEKKKLLIGKSGWKLLMNTFFTTNQGEELNFDIEKGVKALNTTLNKIWGKELLDKKIGDYKIRTLITGIEEKQGGYGIPESFIRNLWDKEDWKTNKINTDSTLEIKKKGEKTWWIEQAEKYLNEKQQIKNIIYNFKSWVEPARRKVENSINKDGEEVEENLNSIFGDWEKTRQQVKEYNSTTSRGLLEEITNLVENNSNICKTTEENKNILNLEKLNSPNFNTNKLFKGDYVITAKKCDDEVEKQAEDKYRDYCIKDSFDFKYSWYTMDSIRRQLENSDEELIGKIDEFIKEFKKCNTGDRENLEQMICNEQITDAYEAAQKTSKTNVQLIKRTDSELADYTYEEKKFIEGLFRLEEQPGYGTIALDAMASTREKVGEMASSLLASTGVVGGESKIETNKKARELKKLKNLYKKMNNKKNKKQAEIEKLKKYIKTK